MYAPRCIWLSMEGGLMEFLVRDKTGSNVNHNVDLYQNTILLIIRTTFQGGLWKNLTRNINDY